MYRRSSLAAVLALLLQVPAAAAAADAPLGPRPVLEQTFVIAIDAGHGGTNAGCSSFAGDAREKQVTLALALELRDALAERLPAARVVLTRDGDRTLTLADRVAIANDVEADLFLSLHANASATRTQQGFETYVLDARASTLEAARTARRENESAPSTLPPAAREPVADAMLRQLAMTQQRTAAARLAMRMQQAQHDRFPDRLDRGVKQAPFDVLMGARMPAVLFEAGFLDHPAEAHLLTDPQSRARVVDGLVEAIVEYYRAQG